MLVATAPGLRDQRARIYVPSDTFVEGYQSTKYNFTNEYWTRVEIATSRESVAPDPQQHIDYRIEATALFDSYASIPQSSILSVDGVYYFVRGIVPTRMLNTQVVSLELISTDRFNTFVLVETPIAPVPDKLPVISPIPSTPGHAV